MVLDPDAAFQTAITEGTVKVAELYQVTLTNGSVFRYTSHSQDLEWGASGEVWTAIPIMRNSISTNINLEMDAVILSIANITGDLFDEVQNNVLDAVSITIKRILWNEAYAAGMEIIAFVGVADVEFDRQVLVLRCKSVLDSLNIQVPKDIFQEPCNNQHYGTTCGLIRTDFAYAGTVSTGTDLLFTDSTRGTVFKGIFDNASGTIAIGDTITGGNNGYTALVVQVVYLTATTGFIWYIELSNSANFEDDEVLANGGDTVTLNGVPVEDTIFYQQGEVEVTSGSNNGQRRPILKNSGNTVTVFWPFPNDMAAGDTYNIYPGCDKTSIVCTNTFDNASNFRGFMYIPKIEETIT